MTLKELSFSIDVNYRTLKRWKSGTTTIPYIYFNKMESIFPELFNFKKYAKELSVHWGQSLGGTKFTTLIDKKKLGKRMKYVRSFRKFREVEIPVHYKGKIILRTFRTKDKPIRASIDNDKILEFYGILMGDGFISQYLSNNQLRMEIGISGNSIKDLEYFRNYVVPLIKEKFGIKTKIKFRKTSNTIDIQIINRGLFEWLKNNGFPIGKKGQIFIPEHIIKLPSKKINNLIRGIFDTDGCISARKDEKYRYPYIFIATVSVPLRKQLKELLRRQGLPAYIHAHTVVLRGRNNFKKWFQLIGSKNPRNLKLYKEFMETERIGSIGKGS